MNPVRRRQFCITRKYNVSETGPVSKFPCSSEERETVTLLGLSLIQWFRLVLSKGPNSVDVSFPSVECGYRFSFGNVVFPDYSEYRRLDKVHEHNNSE
jgi:hypothetical protein